MQYSIIIIVIFPQAFNINIDRGIIAPGHFRSVVDAINGHIETTRQ